MSDQITDTPVITETSQPNKTVIVHPQDTSYTHLVSGLSVNAVPVPDNMNDRVRQQEIIPNAIANRFFGDLVSFSKLLTLPLVITNNTSTTITSKVSDNTNRTIMAIPQVSIYIGITSTSQIKSDGSNQWPTAAVGGGNFPIYFNPFDYGQSNNVNQVMRVTCRNNTGSDQQILVIVQWKLLTVPSPTTNRTAGS